VANLRPINNLIVSPDTSTLWRAVLNDLTAELGRFWIEAAIDCLRAISDGKVSVDRRYTDFLICTYKFRTAIKTFAPLHIFISWNPWHLFEDPWGSAEPGVENTGIKCNTGSLFYLTLSFVISGSCSVARVGSRLSRLLCEPTGSGSLQFYKLVALFYPNIIVST